MSDTENSLTSSMVPVGRRRPSKVTKPGRRQHSSDIERNDPKPGIFSRRQRVQKRRGLANDDPPKPGGSADIPDTRATSRRMSTEGLPYEPPSSIDTVTSFNEISPENQGRLETGRISADTPPRRMTSSEDESLVSAESREKEKSPADEYLSITMPSTPSRDDGLEDEVVAETVEQPKKLRSSILKKWKKKVTESFSKPSIDKGDGDVEEKATEVKDKDKAEPATMHVVIEDETKCRPVLESGPMVSPSTKRHLRRREKAGEFTPDQKILGIKIHQTDLLPTDPNTCHPVVRVTFMTSEGHYLTKRSGTELTLTTKTVGQVMTRPSFVTGSGFCRLLPKWEEMLVVDEGLERFLSPDILLFFEIMDFVPMNHHSLSRTREPDLGWYKIAWAFLRPLGVNGTTKHVNRRVRLQLYSPQLTKGQRVYDWFRSKRRTKLNSTLYVTLKGILPPDPAHRSPQSKLSQLMRIRKDQLTQALIEGQLSLGQRSTSEESQVQNSRPVPQWKRFPGQSCKVPNTLLKSLPASGIDSFNFRVVGNVQCVKFSPCGTLLASGLDTEEYHAVLIFEIPSGKLLKSLRGHHGLIYDLAWTHNGGRTYSIASASGDFTARVWKLQLETNGPLNELWESVLSHPSYVYTLQFSPVQPSYLVTGCYDSAIRVWKLKPTENQNQTVDQQSAPLYLVTGHRSYINSIRFHPNGDMLFSGDGRGVLCEWRWLTRGKQRQAPKLEKETKLVSSGHVAITSICLDTTGRKLLVQLAQSCLKILDVQTFLVLNTFKGLANERLRLQSVLSPCGNLVLSGSEDSTLFVWDADTGRLLSQLRPPNHPSCVLSSVSYHPYDHYVAVGLLSPTEEPQPVVLYGFEYPPGKELSIETITKIRTTFAPRRTIPRSDNLEEPESSKRGDISEKFQSILQKLDEVTGGTPRLATVTKELLDAKKMSE